MCRTGRLGSICKSSGRLCATWCAAKKTLTKLPAPTRKIAPHARGAPVQQPHSQAMLPKFSVLQSNISTGRVADFVDAILRLGAARSSAYVCFANVHMLMEAEQN